MKKLGKKIILMFALLLVDFVLLSDINSCDMISKAYAGDEQNVVPGSYEEDSEMPYSDTEYEQWLVYDYDGDGKFAWFDNKKAESNQVDENYVAGSSTISGITLNETNPHLYFINDGVVDEATIPPSYNQSFQLVITGASNVTYTVTSGNSAEVSSTGLITLKKTTYYHYDLGNGWGITTTNPDYPDGTLSYISERYSDDTTYIDVVADGVAFKVQVEVDNYGYIYAQNVLDKYIADNITGKDLSDVELLNVICEFPASYDYSADCSGWDTMVMYGGGDCWASTSAIIEICDTIGIKAWVRNGNKDGGAGSGHMNAMVELNGKHYELEAGYVGTAPRMYSVMERIDLFCYELFNHYYDGGCSVYQYDGYDETETVLMIPEHPNNSTTYEVSSMEQIRCTTYDNYTKIVLPSTMKRIGEFALTGFENLDTLHITEDVEYIGKGALSNTQLNENFTCSEDNQYFTVEDGVLYNKSKTKMISVPTVGTGYIPDVVDTIGAYAFYYNSNVNEIVLPSNVTTIEEAAFAACSDLKLVDLSATSITCIPDFAFADDNLDALVLPATVTSISEHAFKYGSVKYIYGEQNSYAEQYASENNIPFRTGKPSDYFDASMTLSTTGIYVASTYPTIFAGICMDGVTDSANVEYRWVACNMNDKVWFEVQDWTAGSEWLNWKPASGDYVLVCYAREVGDKSQGVSASVGINYHGYIKGMCQMPYTGEGGGYLIGVESYDNPNQSYQYEMLILDCTLLEQGKDAWVYTTGKFTVTEGNAGWTIWQPQYGYYWTLFRVYDADGNMLDQACYSFVNAY